MTPNQRELAEHHENDVDHRFSSEGSVIPGNEDKEELKGDSVQFTPNVFEKPPEKLMTKTNSPYNNPSMFYRPATNEEKKSESNDLRSETDKIKAFMEE